MVNPDYKDRGCRKLGKITFTWKQQQQQQQQKQQQQKTNIHTQTKTSRGTIKYQV